MDKSRIFIGFGQAHNLAIRRQCEMLEYSATQKLESPSLSVVRDELSSKTMKEQRNNQPNDLVLESEDDLVI